MTSTVGAGPAPALWSDVPGQEAAVAALSAAAVRPVHAYLLVGPPGTGRMAAATDFAAALLCPHGGDGTCDSCRRVREGTHPDVVVVEREGAYITVDDAHEVARLAARSPVEGDRKVLVLRDFHLVREAGPALLKTIEEPPPSAVFVVVAEWGPPELVTIASRCVLVEFAPLAPATVVAALVADGIDHDKAVALSEVAQGRLDRARLLAADPEFAARRLAWAAVPGRLDGRGHSAAVCADELVALLDRSVAPLRQRQEAEIAALEERNTRALEVNGKLGKGSRSGVKAGVAEMETRHKRELRRQRTDELRTGLATLAAAYRDRLAASTGRPGGVDLERARAAASAVALVDAAGCALANNPGELLLLQGLLARLGRLAATGPAAG